MPPYVSVRCPRCGLTQSQRAICAGCGAPLGRCSIEAATFFPQRASFARQILTASIVLGGIFLVSFLTVVWINHTAEPPGQQAGMMSPAAEPGAAPSLERWQWTAPEHVLTIDLTVMNPLPRMLEEIDIACTLYRGKDVQVGLLVKAVREALGPAMRSTLSGIPLGPVSPDVTAAECTLGGWK